MKRRRVPISLIAPIALVLLLGALGVIQYRWVGQVSERERDELRQSLDGRARAFADDFDRELSLAYDIFLPGALPPPPPPGPSATPESPALTSTALNARLTRGLLGWRTTSRFARLIKSVYYVEAKGAEPRLRKFDPESSTLGDPLTTWPASLTPVRSRVTSIARNPSPSIGASGSMNVFTITSGSSVLPNVPAILVPDFEPAVAATVVQPRAGGPAVPRAVAPAPPPPPAAPPKTTERPRVAAGGRMSGAPVTTGVATFQMMVAEKPAENYIVLELDRDFIKAELLPALAASHFPTSGGDGFRMVVTDTRAEPVFSRDLPADAVLDLRTADAAIGFFGIRTEMMYSAVTDRRRATPGAAPPAAVAQDTIIVGRSGGSAQQTRRMVETLAAAGAPQFRTVGGAWTLLLQHRAGSLDAVVTQARRRNLMLSFGILGVLAISAGLIVVNARRAEKLAAQQMEFVATVSHELRTPLAVIRSAAQNLSAGVVDDPGQARKYGELIDGEGRRLTDMVEQVLEYAGMSDAKRRVGVRPIDAGTVVRDVVTAVTSLPEATDVAIDVSIEPELPPILADEEAIRRALHNLIGNALKYAADGRWIGVTATRATGTDAGFVRMSVADRGRGIPAADLVHVFEPFYRGRHAVDQQIRGNGLGLSLVKRIAESGGGRVTVESTPDKGATFTLYLPIATGVGEAASAGLATPSLEDAATGRGPSA